MFVVIGVSLIIYVAYRLYQHLFPALDIHANGLYVLITGCDTGFGHALAIDLDKQGFHVLAGVYNADNRQSLTGHLSARATVFCLDVTREDDIDAVHKLVKGKTKTLHALVNNAGIGKVGLFDWTSIDFMRRMMEVNFFGQVMMTKKFLPLLLAKRGSRVVNLCSVAGFLAGPGASAYCTSKFALEAFSDSLRREMLAWGLHVSIIEPAYMRTSIIEGQDHAIRDLWMALDEETKDRWGENFCQQLMAHALKNPFIRNAENPQKVVRALRHAVMNSAPRIRYRPGWQSSLFFFPFSMLPAWLVDLFLCQLRGMDTPPAGLVQQLK